MSFVGKFIYNNQPEPIPGYQFTAIVNFVPMGFSKITNVERTFELETFHEGGVNDRPRLINMPNTTEKTLILERGIAFRGLAYDAVSNLEPGDKIKGDVVLLVFNRDGGIMKAYFVEGAVVKKWSCSDFDAASGELLIERFELSYTKLDTSSLANAAITASIIF